MAPLDPKKPIPAKPNAPLASEPTGVAGYLRKLEYFVEGMLFSSRWLLAPFFIGLAVSILILLIKFVQELAHVAGNIFEANGTQLVAEVLGLVDLTLTASLLIIVVFSGY